MSRLSLSNSGGNLLIKCDGVKVGTPLEVPKSLNSKGLFSILAAPFRFLKNQIAHISKDADRTSVVHVKLIGENGKIIEKKQVLIKTDSVRSYLLSGNTSKDFRVTRIVSTFGNDEFNLEIQSVRRIESPKQNHLSFEEFSKIINQSENFSATEQSKKSSEAVAQESPASNNRTFANVDSSIVNEMRKSLQGKKLEELQELRFNLRQNIERKVGNPDKQNAYLSLVNDEIYFCLYGERKPVEPQDSKVQAWKVPRVIRDL